MFMKLKLFFDSQKAAVLTLLYGVCVFFFVYFVLVFSPHLMGKEY